VQALDATASTFRINTLRKLQAARQLARRHGGIILVRGTA
jgi:hypothetical protein